MHIRQVYEKCVGLLGFATFSEWRDSFAYCSKIWTAEGSPGSSDGGQQPHLTIKGTIKLQFCRFSMISIEQCSW